MRSPQRLQGASGAQRRSRNEYYIAFPKIIIIISSRFACTAVFNLADSQTISQIAFSVCQVRNQHYWKQAPPKRPFKKFETAAPSSASSQRADFRYSSSMQNGSDTSVPRLGCLSKKRKYHQVQLLMRPFSKSANARPTSTHTSDRSTGRYEYAAGCWYLSCQSVNSFSVTTQLLIYGHW